MSAALWLAHRVVDVVGVFTILASVFIGASIFLVIRSESPLDADDEIMQVSE